ncbi:MAG: M56 family metallopeptidase [Gammaproteobacteria bacterium]|jgi:Zn-dependent protease with chaperone function
MTLTVGLIAAALTLVFLVALGVGLASRLFCRAIDGWLGTLPPATRANVLFAWALSPLVVGLVMLLLVFLPSLAHLLGFAADHCHEHDHHAHLCLIHTPFFTGAILEQLMLVGAGIVVFGYILEITQRLRRGHRTLRTLLALVKPSTAHAPYRIIDSPRPFAITIGLARPQVVISSRLVDSLKPAELSTVVSHEQAHQHRRDGLRLFAAEVLSALHVPTTRRLILNGLGLAIEQACDEVAAVRSGDRLQVAETIIKMARLAGRFIPMPGALGAVSTGSNVMLRVERLLRPRRPVGPRLSDHACLMANLMIAVGLATGDWWHHSAESLFSILLS